MPLVIPIVAAVATAGATYAVSTAVQKKAEKAQTSAQAQATADAEALLEKQKQAELDVLAAQKKAQEDLIASEAKVAETTVGNSAITQESIAPEDVTALKDLPSKIEQSLFNLTTLWSQKLITQNQPETPIIVESGDNTSMMLPLIIGGLAFFLMLKKR